MREGAGYYVWCMELSLVFLVQKGPLLAVLEIVDDDVALLQQGLQVLLRLRLQRITRPLAGSRPLRVGRRRTIAGQRRRHGHVASLPGT